jgi:hypothetical protein
MCLGIQTGRDGKEIAHRAGMYSSEPTERMLEKRLPEPEEFKTRRQKAAESTLNQLKGMFE